MRQTCCSSVRIAGKHHGLVFLWQMDQKNEFVGSVAASKAKSVGRKLVERGRIVVGKKVVLGR